MKLRAYVPSDLEGIRTLFQETVRTINARDYTPQQVEAWAAGAADREAWDRSLSAHRCLVAEENGVILGFGDMDERGYLDRLYVHRDRQRQGIASALCAALEAGAAGKTVTVHASITALPFFLRRGYRVVREQQVMRRGVYLKNYVMERPAPLSSERE